MDENFLLHRKRALRLLELMKEHNKAWGLAVFSSANVLRSYTMDQLVGLGITWVWMGMEGKGSQYTKLNGADTHSLVRDLQAHGIRVLGSSIIGLEEHTPENIGAAIDYAVSHDTEFHQFMLYTPIPGTPLYAEHREKGTLLPQEEYDEADIHGQLVFNYRHPHIPRGQETQFLVDAFQRDFEVNGPSIARVARTLLAGWKKFKNHPDMRIRKRYARQSEGLSTSLAGSVWAARQWFKNDPALTARFDDVLKEIYREFGMVSRILVPIIGRFILLKLKQENKRLARGWTYEPPTFYEKNAQAVAQTPATHSLATPAKWAAAVALMVTVKELQQ
jgi:hypothetical protein